MGVTENITFPGQPILEVRQQRHEARLPETDLGRFPWHFPLMVMVMVMVTMITSKGFPGIPRDLDAAVLAAFNNKMYFFKVTTIKMYFFTVFQQITLRVTTTGDLTLERNPMFTRSTPRWWETLSQWSNTFHILSLLYLKKWDIMWKRRLLNPIQSILKEWGGLPRDLSAGFLWKNNKNYFFKDDTYWRFSERWLLDHSAHRCSTISISI